MAEDYTPPYAAQVPNKLALQEYHPQRMGPAPYLSFAMVSARAATEDDGTPKLNTLGGPYYDDLSQMGEVVSVSVYSSDPAGKARLLQLWVSIMADALAAGFAEAGVEGQNPAAIAQALALKGKTVEGVIADRIYEIWREVAAGQLPEPAAIVTRRIAAGPFPGAVPR